MDLNRPRYQVRDQNGDVLHEADSWWIVARYAREWGGTWVFDNETDELQWVGPDNREDD
jgi:hypothetical protein